MIILMNMSKLLVFGSHPKTGHKNRRLVSEKRMVFFEISKNIIFTVAGVIWACSLLSRVNEWIKDISGRQEMDPKWMREANINNYTNVDNTKAHTHTHTHKHTQAVKYLYSSAVDILSTLLLVLLLWLSLFFLLVMYSQIEFYNTYTTCNICS